MNNPADMIPSAENVVKLPSPINRFTPVQGLPSPINKDRFIENVQRWVLIDNQMKIVNEKTNKLRTMKHDLRNQICDYMKDNNLENNKIGLSNGELRLYEKRDYSPLTFTYLEKSLLQIIPDKNHVAYIIKHVKDNREIEVSTDIRATYTKPT
jgi:hypothetical protein